MTVNEALRIVRSRWRVLLSCLLLGLLGASTAALLTPREYSSDVTLYVSLQGRAENSDSAYQANQLAKERVVSYAPLLRDGRITQPVVDRLALPMTAAQLAKHITVTVEPDTVVLTAAVADTSPGRAADTANALAEEFVGLVNQLEQPFGPVPPPGPPGQPAPQPTRIGAQIIRAATPSPIPVSPNVPFGLALGAALGLLVGIGAAFLRNARDTAVRDPARLRDLTSVAVLAEIPLDRDARKYPIALDQAPLSARAEAYRKLRTNLQFSSGGPVGPTGWAKVVVVTSAVVGEGTTATACNLARALADGGSRVLLIDANLRRPQVETYLDLVPGPGLTNVLTNRIRWPFVLRTFHDTPLDVLPPGPVAPRPGELLTWHGMAGLLHEVRQRYEFVIVDAPALLPVSDAATVAARADGVILVVRSGRTSEEQVAGAVDALEAVSARLLGTALVMSPPRRRNGRFYPARPASLLPLLPAWERRSRSQRPAAGPTLAASGSPAWGAVPSGPARADGPNEIGQAGTQPTGAGPITAEPNRTTPVTAEPNETAPVTAEPNRTAPVTAEPNGTAPVTAEHNGTAPVTAQPNASAPSGTTSVPEPRPPSPAPRAGP